MSTLECSRACNRNTRMYLFACTCIIIIILHICKYVISAPTENISCLSLKSGCGISVGMAVHTCHMVHGMVETLDF